MGEPAEKVGQLRDVVEEAAALLKMGARMIDAGTVRLLLARMMVCESQLDEANLELRIWSDQFGGMRFQRFNHQGIHEMTGSELIAERLAAKREVGDGE